MIGRDLAAECANLKRGIEFFRIDVGGEYGNDVADRKEKQLKERQEELKQERLMQYEINKRIGITNYIEM